MAGLLAHQSLGIMGRRSLKSDALVGDFAHRLELATALQTGTRMPFAHLQQLSIPFHPRAEKSNTEAAKHSPAAASSAVSCFCPLGISGLAESLGRSRPRAPAYGEGIIMALVIQPTAPVCFPAWKREKLV